MAFNFRQILRSIFLSTMGSIAKPSPFVHILNGHMIGIHDDSDYNGQRFALLLENLYKYCDFINFENAVDKIINNEKVTRPKVAFSFDDGWRDCYTQIAPQLEKYGVNAMFFINPNAIEATEKNDIEYLNNFTNNITKSPGKHLMNWNQVKDLQRRGFKFGAHTLDHYCINDNNIIELEHQIVDCKSVIEDRLGESCEYFAFPYGRIEHANLTSINIACKHYKYVFSQSDHKHFFSFQGRVINRRHFEPFWPTSHVKYFLSCKRS